jgi:transposase-like protein
LSYYERDFLTRYGPIEDIQVARDRNGEFESQILSRYKRRIDPIDRQIIDLFIGGISPRKMKKVTKELMGKGDLSRYYILKINKQLTIEQRAWMEEPIEDNILYIFLRMDLTCL